MNGAHALIRTLVAAGVDTCFTNPGTSEMHFVAALDDVPEMRAVLGLFEGVVTGAADGYARVADKPAATLLHLGPGLGNGLANLHNARRGNVPVVNIVGDHAIYHERYDAPLQSDIEALASNLNGWVRRSRHTAEVASDAAVAVAAAVGPPGKVATLILPADVSWSDGAEPASPVAAMASTPVAEEAFERVAKVLRSGEQCALLVGGRAVHERGLRAASRVAKATGAKLLCETFPTRLERGAGLPAVERLGYLAEFTQMQLTGVRHLVLIDTKAPVSFFAYPDKPSDLVPADCEVHGLAIGADDVEGALEALADVVAESETPLLQDAGRPDRPTGALNGETIAAAVGALLPEGAIVSDEANTAGLWLNGATAGAPRHDWLTLTGGAIGQGMPVATGAAVAGKGRKVLSLEADGSAMYTLQSLWTQVREGLDVTTVIFNNRSYAILNLELSRVGAGAGGPKAHDMLDISRPDLDFVSLATGMGVPATRATTAEEFTTQLEAALAHDGPNLIEAIIPSGF
ncbi:MAG: acetolactate synthase large subunit [Actinobacteria bacterium]|nr:acetolactate synthase large subunit [Actinomycetota bacterium]